MFATVFLAISCGGSYRTRIEIKNKGTDLLFWVQELFVSCACVCFSVFEYPFIFQALPTKLDHSTNPARAAPGLYHE